MPLQGKTSEWGVWSPEPQRTLICEDGPRGRRFFGYQATNKCCRDWMVLGWPSTPEGQPVKRDVSRDPVFGVTCPSCGKWIYFDLAHWDIVVERDPEGAQPAVLVAGRIRV